MRFFIKENKYNKLATLDEKRILYLRKMSPLLDRLLSYNVFSKYKDFWIKGGVARYALMLYFNKKVYGSDVRDVDGIFFSKDVSKFKELVNGLSSDIDVENYIFGIDKFLSTTDIAHNSVILRPDKMIFSRRAVNALQNDKISSTVLDRDVSERLGARMLLFAARYNLSVSNELSFRQYDGFDMLAVLLKAYQLNIQDKFFDLVKKNKLNFGTHTLPDFFEELVRLNPHFNIGEERINMVFSKMTEGKVSVDQLLKIFPKEYVSAFNDISFEDIPAHLIKKYNRTTKGK